MRSFPSWRRLALILPFLAAGCAHVPATSLAQLSKLDLMTADLKGLRAAVRAPSAIGLVPGGALLVLTYWRDGEDKKNVRAELEEDPDPKALANLEDDVKPGTRITVFRIPEAERARLDAVRAAIAAEQAQDKGGRRAHATLSVSLAGCTRAPPPEGPLLTTTYLQITPDGDFFPLVRDLDLRSLKGDGVSTGAGALKPCAA